MFTQNWSSGIAISLNKIYGVNLPTHKVNVAEIGCFEGRGSLILSQMLCKDEGSKLYCIDPWFDLYTKGIKEFENLDPLFVGQYDKFVKNTKSIADRIIPLRGLSDDMIPELPSDIDFVYIDGDHSPDQVYKDAVGMLGKMKKGGYMVFDDYGWIHNGIVCAEGIDRFLEEYKDQLTVIEVGYHLIVRVKQ